MNQIIKQARLPKGAYQTSLEDVLGKFKEEKQWCKNHPISLWTKGFAQCREGFVKEEKCERGE